MEQKAEHDFLYNHIQSLYRECNCNINVLDDNQLINELTKKKFSIKQLESICAIRYWYWVKVLKNLRYIKETHYGTSDTTIATNLSFISTEGSDYALIRNANQDEFGINTYYINPTKAECFGKLIVQSNLVKKNISKARILYIGARTEAEIMYMANFGINPRNITAIDLHTYSPLIELGDMHSMRFQDNTFDACILAHCIAYSEKPEIALREAHRVIKDGGSLIFTVSTIHESKHSKSKQTKYEKPRTGAKNLLTFKQYYELARSLGRENSESKEHEVTLRGQTFMRAGVIVK